MFTSVMPNLRNSAAAVIAGALVAFSGVALNQGPSAPSPRGVVEIGQLETIEVGTSVYATLPEVVVRANRPMLARRPSADDRI
jgi:hypothetical protein